jgi:hypothetical protein
MNFFRPFTNVVQFIKQHVGKLISGNLCIILAVNHTKDYRMFRRLKEGKYGIHSPRKDFKFDFCELKDDLDLIEGDFLSTNGSFVGLIGLKATGKTSTLKYEANKYKEFSIFCEIDPRSHTTLTEFMYERMYQDIWKMPWFARQIRFNGSLSHKAIVHNVFEKVVKNGNTVKVFIDVSTSEVSPDSTEILDKIPFEVTRRATSDKLFASSLVREVKKLVQDNCLINCMIASSKGLMFEAEANREGRFRVYRYNELPLEMSKNYLKEKFDYKGDEVLLKQIPRAFDILAAFGAAKNKESFAQKSFAKHAKNIEKSIEAFPLDVKHQGEAKGPKALYQKALKEDIGIKDIVHIGGMTEEQFIQAFVTTNIFRPTDESTWTLQFDVVRLAAEKVVGQ